MTMFAIIANIICIVFVSQIYGQYTTSLATPPGTIQCGDQNAGTYNGQTITFIVHLPHRGDMTFDASNSNFQVTAMEGHLMQDTRDQLIASDMDHDGILTLHDMTSGNYKFLIYGGTQMGLVYHVRITCTSQIPTLFPSLTPTQGTIRHTQYNMTVPTSSPSVPPTTAAPIYNSSLTPTIILSDYPTVAPQTLSPTGSPTNWSIVSSQTLIDISNVSSTEWTETQSDHSGLNQGFIGIEHIKLIAIMAGSFLGLCGCTALLWYLWMYVKRKQKAQQMLRKTHDNVVAKGNVDRSRTHVQSTDTFNAFHTEQPTEKQPEKSNVLPHFTIPPAIKEMDEKIQESSSSVVLADWGAIHPQNALENFRMPPAVKEVDEEIMETAGGESSSSSSTVVNLGRHIKNGNQDVSAQLDGEGASGQCTDCSKYKMGQVYDGDGMFYCDECWRNYRC